MPDPRPSIDGLDVEAHLREPLLKQRFVTPMFDIIAPRYDDFTRLFSFGMDARWKAALVARAVAAVPTGGQLLDVACGTGDIGLAVARARPDVEVTGLDVSARMIALAERRRRRDGVPNAAFMVGDLTHIPLGLGRIDVVTAGYALRNVPDHREALVDIARVMREGGRLLTLDFYRPENTFWRALWLSYLRVAGDIFGLAWHRRPVIYGYIARSIAHYVSWQDFGRGMKAAGFSLVGTHAYFLGGIAMHEAARLTADAANPR